MNEICNGYTVRDIITGFSGRVVGIVDYITGCRQALIQPLIDDRGQFVESRWVDIDRLEVSSKDLPVLRNTANGPDKAAPRR